MNKKLKNDFPKVDSGILHQDGRIRIYNCLVKSSETDGFLDITFDYK